MRTLLLVVLSSILCACSSVPVKDFKITPEEALWQGLHVADVVQTYKMVDTCFHESDPGTRRLIGKDPSKEKVLVWGVLVGIGHWLASETFRTSETGKYKPAYTFWQVVTTSLKFKTIYDNEQIGMTVNGPEMEDGKTCNEGD